MLAAFTPKRWELMGVLRESGPCSVRALAGKLGRDYKNVHTDVAALELWMAVERLDDGRVWVPWDEISVDLQLPRAVAA
jgi:predicted transcriptional regulator